MTGKKMMADENWGARQERRRTAQRWKLEIPLVAAAVIVLIGSRLADHWSGTGAVFYGDVARLLLGIGYVAVVMGVAARMWRQRDEVQRQLAIQCYAAIGLASAILLPLFMIIEPATHMPNPAIGAWITSAAIGLLVYLIQRYRR